MNEHIERCQELAAEFASSRIDDSDEDWSFRWDRDYDFKFAELLLQECFKVMEEEDNYYGSWMGNVLKKHFDTPNPLEELIHQNEQLTGSYYISCANQSTKLTEHFKVPESIYVYVKQMEYKVNKLENSLDRIELIETYNEPKN